MDGLPPNDPEPVQFVNEAELLLLRARQMSRRIHERIWSVMSTHEAVGPHWATTYGDRSHGAQDGQAKDDEQQEAHGFSEY